MTPEGRGCLFSDLRTVQEAHDQVTQKAKDRHPLLIRAELETVGKIRIKAKADFPVHLHGLYLHGKYLLAQPLLHSVADRTANLDFPGTSERASVRLEIFRRATSRPHP